MRRSAVIVSLVTALAGCRTTSMSTQNPSHVANADHDFVWNQVICVVEKYFDVAYENRWDGSIETLPQTGATCIEPWLADAVGPYERLEGTLQTIRRRAFVLVQPAPTGGYTIAVEVYKELEDVMYPSYATFAGGTFVSSIEPIKEEVVTSAIRAPAGWISLGRDAKLEAAIADDISRAIDGSL